MLTFATGSGTHIMFYSKHNYSTYLTAASSVLWLISRSRNALVRAEHVHAWTDITNRQYVTTSVSVSVG